MPWGHAMGGGDEWQVVTSYRKGDRSGVPMWCVQTAAVSKG